MKKGTKTKTISDLLGRNDPGKGSESLVGKICETDGLKLEVKE